MSISDLTDSRSLLYRHVLGQGQRVQVLLEEMEEGRLEGAYAGMPHGLAFWWDARSIFYRRFPTRQQYCRSLLTYLRRLIYTQAMEVFGLMRRTRRLMDNRRVLRAEQIISGLRSIGRRPPALTGSARLGRVMRAPALTPSAAYCFSGAIRAEAAMLFYGVPMVTREAFSFFWERALPPEFVQIGPPVFRPFDNQACGSPEAIHDQYDDDDSDDPMRQFGRDYW